MFQHSYVRKSNLQIFIWVVIEFAAYGLFPLLSSAQTSRVRLDIDFGGYSGSECHANNKNLQIAGSQSEIVVRVSSFNSDFAYRGLPVAPNGLVFSATTRPFSVSSNGLVYFPVDRLQPRFYVTFHQALNDSNAQSGVQLSPRSRSPEYHFLITLPEDLAGRTLSVHAELNDPEFGHLEGDAFLDIVAPCSQRDRDQVAGSYIKFAFDRQDYSLAISLTDSLLQTGWCWGNALIYSMDAAAAQKDYDRDLHYLDVFFSTYKTVPFASPFDSARAQTDYQQQREHILNLRNQQQQQNQSQPR
jgi:hypothetical protein